jgi:hypothetical protein
MKHYSKIFIIVIISSLLVTSSCKKEEEIIEGCTESTAMNYNATATSNDGSCIFAYDIAQGLWFFDFTCDSTGIPMDLIKDFLPNSINVEGEGGGNLSFIILDTLSVNGTIDTDGNVIIDEQALFSIDTLGFTVPVLVSGNGTIISADSGDLKLEYKASIAGLFELFKFSCEATLGREEFPSP